MFGGLCCCGFSWVACVGYGLVGYLVGILLFGFIYFSDSVSAVIIIVLLVFCLLICGLLLFAFFNGFGFIVALLLEICLLLC